MLRAKRVAVLADIHGNLPALEAVLADVETATPDLVVLNGDLADGPFPAETLERLDALGAATLWLRGNGDRWLAEAHGGTFAHPDAETDAMLRWAAERLTCRQRERLASLPLSAVVEIAGLGQVGFCHASARSDNEMLLVDSSLDHATAAFAGLKGETLAVGHSHMPFDRLFGRRRVVNAGSVGMPYGHSGASWLLLGPDAVLKRTNYDAGDAAERMLETGMPGVLAFVDTYIRHTPDDAEALASFRIVMQKQQDSGTFT